MQRFKYPFQVNINPYTNSRKKSGVERIEGVFDLSKGLPPWGLPFFLSPLSHYFL